MSTPAVVATTLAQAASARRTALLVGSLTAAVSVVLSVLSLSFVDEAQRWQVVQTMTIEVVLSILLVVAWVLVLAPGRRLRPRHAIWVAAAALLGLQAAGFVHIQLILAARAGGWSATQMVEVSATVSFLLRMVLCGATVWPAVRLLAGPPAGEPTNAGELVAGRAFWVCLGLYQGAVLVLNAVVYSQVPRLGTLSMLAIDGDARWWWSLLFLAAAALVAWAARPALARKPGRRRWLLGFAVSAAAGALALVLAVRVAWRALRIVELPFEVLLPMSTLAWAFGSLGLVAALLGGRVPRTTAAGKPP